MGRRSAANRSRPLDHGDPRTPMAWQHRNINYQQHHQMYPEQRGAPIGVSPGEQYSYPTEQQFLEEIITRESAGNKQYCAASQPPRPASPSTDTSATSCSTADPDNHSQIKYGAALPIEDIRRGTGPPTLPGTLRSVQSTLTTWDGEPCPVHHLAMPVPILLPPPPPPMYPMLTLPPPPPQAVLLPPMLRPRPLVMSAEKASLPEPLPVRDPKSCLSPLPPKESSTQSQHLHCCKGHIVVLWIILGIIITGIILGVILRFVIA